MAHGPASFSIVLYPSDEFGEQELPAAEIPSFVSQFFPLSDDNDVHLMAKTNVNGDDPVWQVLKASFPGDVNWNFDGIFLLDRDGIAVGRYTASQLERLDVDLRYLLTQERAGDAGDA